MRPRRASTSAAVRAAVAGLVADRRDAAVLDEDVGPDPHLALLPVPQRAAPQEHAASHQLTIRESRSGVVPS